MHVIALPCLSLFTQATRQLLVQCSYQRKLHYDVTYTALHWQTCCVKSALPAVACNRAWQSCKTHTQWANMKTVVL